LTDVHGEPDDAGADFFLHLAEATSMGIASRIGRWLSCWLVLLPLAFTAADEAPAPKNPLDGVKERMPAPGDDALRKLQIERFNAALREAGSRFEHYQLGRTNFLALTDAVRRLMLAERDMARNPAEMTAALQRWVDFLKEADRIAEAMFQAGRIAPADRELARYSLLDAQIELLKAQRAQKPNKP
jgi:hypothetical protein